VGDALAYDPYYTSEIDGELLRWFDADVDVYISTLAPTEISVQELEDAVTEAMLTWTSVGECALPQLRYAGLLDEDVATYNKIGGNDNLVVPVHSQELWASKGFSSTVIAMTTLTYSKSTGRIYDADIELNDWNFKFSTGDPVPPGASDILNTLVHEMGHFLGLDHSSVASASMFAHAPDGESKKRDLHDDDIEGICFMYDSFPWSVADTAPNDAAGGSEPGCSLTTITGNKNETLGTWTLALLLGTALILRRRSTIEASPHDSAR
jgi:hypothetical protein